ncbi:MAG: hypothetical protein ACFFB0_15025 [Promethearchaeota archaeon]
MSQTVTVFQRCPRCGNENPAESFACNFCGVRLKIERIEKFSIFRRVEKEWIKPESWYTKFFWLLVKPNHAFWDINHKRSKAPGGYILLFCSLLYGLMGLAVASHFNLVSFSPYSPMVIFFYFTFFVTFFVFGFFFQLIFFAILIWLFTKGANYAVGFTERLETRFGGLKETKEKYKEAEISPFSIYKGGTMLQIEASHKFSMMLCAFTPFIVINTIKILIMLVGFQTIPIEEFNYNLFDEILDQIFASPTWGVIDMIDALTIAIWVPILTTLAIRELSNSSTSRVLIPSLIIGITVAIIFYFLRPTLFG